MKKMTEAFKKVQDYRDTMNAGRTKIMAKDLSCVVYLYQNRTGHCCVITYRGRAKKPEFNYRYNSYDARTQKVTEWMQAQSKKTINRKAEERKLVVGDVLRASWGYEQTNIDYYKVTKLSGKTMVEIVEIGCKRVETMSMQGQSIPDPDNVTSKPIRRRAKGESVKVDSVRYASKKYAEEVACCKVYSSDYWTAYH